MNTVLSIYGGETEAEMEQAAFGMFCNLHPHEAHAKCPDRFWAYVQTQCPGVSRGDMEASLLETDEPNATEHRQGARQGGSNE